MYIHLYTYSYTHTFTHIHVAERLKPVTHEGLIRDTNSIPIVSDSDKAA